LRCAPSGLRLLREVPDLPEQAALNKMNPEGLSINDGVVLTSILKEKADRLNKAMRMNDWTLRKLEMVLWTYGR
jgi:hypothetical protein